jgi:hypothetical protein
MLQIDSHTHASVLSTYATYTNLWVDYQQSTSATLNCDFSFLILLRVDGRLLEILMSA